MSLSKDTVALLVDMIENKLALMADVSDREEVREMVTLQRCLTELKGDAGAESTSITACAIPTRGRHKKLSRLLDEYDVPQKLRRQA